MAAYLANTGGTSRQPKQVTPNDVFIGKRLTKKQRARAKRLTREFVEVFMRSPDDIPPPWPNVDPVEWTLKEGHTAPIRCSKPNWGPAQEAFLRDWTERALKAGLIVRAQNSEWASRPVLVPKYRGDTPKGAVSDDIRVCVD